MRAKKSVPVEVVELVTQIILRSLEEANRDWTLMTQHQKSELYMQWANNQQIRTLLGSYVDNIRGYLKDDVMRPLQHRQRTTEDMEDHLKKLLTDRFSIDIIDTVECRKTKTECRLLWRLKGTMFLVVVGGRAEAWRSLLVKTMEWDIDSRKRLKGLPYDRKPILILFRASGDTLGRANDQNLARQLATRCGVELIILSPKQKYNQEIATHPLPLFAEQEG